MTTKLEEVSFENGLSFNWQEFTKGTFVEHNGIYLTDIGKGFVNGELKVESYLLNPAGVLHGGVTVALADTLAIMGCGYLYEAVSLTTTNLSVQYLKAVTKGLIKGKGRVLSQGGAVSTWQIDEYNEKDELFATAQVSFFINA